MINTVKIQGEGYLVNGTMSVPKADGNRDYEEVKQFIADGGIVEPEFTDAELLLKAKASMESVIQSHIDSQAQSLGYDGIVSACSYAGYINEFQTEAVELGVWRSAVWTKAYQVQADVEAGTIPMPTVDELIAMLPIFGA